MDFSMDTLKNKLRDRGYKLTPQRRAVLEVIVLNPGEHLSTEEIYELVKKNNHPEIGLATVYRTLILLAELDVISKLNLEDGLVRYELNQHDDNHHHHHLICTSCGKVIEVVEDLLDELEARIEQDHEFEICDHKLKFFGICKECKNSL